MAHSTRVDCIMRKEGNKTFVSPRWNITIFSIAFEFPIVYNMTSIKKGAYALTSTRSKLFYDMLRLALSAPMRVRKYGRRHVCIVRECTTIYQPLILFKRVCRWRHLFQGMNQLPELRKHCFCIRHYWNLILLSYTHMQESTRLSCCNSSLHFQKQYCCIGVSFQ